MKLLIDTHCWIWWFSEFEKLSQTHQSLLGDPHNQLYFSAASSLEISIKYQLGKLKLPQPPKEYIPSRLAKHEMIPLAIQNSHAVQVSELPLHHRDPFDRVLIAQSQIENLPILTSDKEFKKYDIKVI